MSDRPITTVYLKGGGMLGLGLGFDELRREIDGAAFPTSFISTIDSGGMRVTFRASEIAAFEESYQGAGVAGAS